MSTATETKLGKAFPQPAVDASGAFCDLVGGMTLRDYFAGHAMQGIISHYGVMQEKPPTCAKTAIEFADALINALASTP